jgi:hypothetical protein
LCTFYGPGKTHDFALLKASKTNFLTRTKVLADSGYQGIAGLHANCQTPKKKTKKNPLTKADKKANRELASQRIANENSIGCVKRFRIIAEKYRNRRKRFALRFNLIAAIHNLNL